MPTPTFTPAHPGPFADPFVLLHEGTYYAYGTGPLAPDGRAFEVLVSDDLRAWRSVGHALWPLPHPIQQYWAPEVAYSDGRFYMYYSAGARDLDQQLRVAVADHPAGPFQDSGVLLDPEAPFTIDPDPFRDDDGQWYLYHVRDYLDGERVGSALAVSALDGMTRLRGAPRSVLRASGDWQVFQRGRLMYGEVRDWHTLEGPCVLRRHGRYWCLYSGGSYENDSYGVGCAVADHPLGPWTEPVPGPAVLRTVPGALIGPGHNSVVRGPDGQDHMVFHAWDPGMTARRMFIAPLTWTAEGPRVADLPAH